MNRHIPCPNAVMLLWLLSLLCVCILPYAKASVATKAAPTFFDNSENINDITTSQVIYEQIHFQSINELNSDNTGNPENLDEYRDGAKVEDVKLTDMLRPGQSLDDVLTQKKTTETLLKEILGRQESTQKMH